MKAGISAIILLLFSALAVFASASNDILRDLKSAKSPSLKSSSKGGTKSPKATKSPKLRRDRLRDLHASENQGGLLSLYFD